MLKLLIFDMDGVIVNNEPINYNIIMKVFNDFGLDVSEKEYFSLLGASIHEIRLMIGEKLAKTSQEITPDNVIATMVNSRIEYIKNEVLPLTTGLLEFLEKLKTNNIGRALASSSSLEIIGLIISKHNIKDCFQAIIGSDNVSRGKPFPDLFLYAANQVNVAPEECLVLEDSANGVKAARAAKMKSVGLQGFGEQDLSGADIVVDDLRKLRIQDLKDLFD
ncbi:MAG: HAD family phosphatase [bacterium]|nr:HAD family phosphatase [bacterium]